MAYDEDLAARVRDLLEGGGREQQMFGGLGFLLEGGHMAVCVGDGELLVRVAPDDAPALRDLDGVVPMEMAGRASRTWVRVSGHLLTGDDLEPWVRRGEVVAASLPPKLPGG